MQKSFACALALGAVFAAAALPLRAQGAAPAPTSSDSSLDFAFTCQATLSNVVSSSSFWLEGGGVQIHGRFYRGLGVVADIAGAHQANINASGVGLDLVTATFGPRYTLPLDRGRYAIYGQALGGIAQGFNSVFPNANGAQTTASSLAFRTGGGLQVRLKPHLALRLFELDYLRTQLPNSTTNVQNNLSVAAGLVLQFR
jgi:hypothetical protein